MLKFVRAHPYLSQLLLAFAMMGVLSLVFLIHSLLSGGSVIGNNLLSGIGLLSIGFVAFTLLTAYPMVILGYQLIIFIQALRWRNPQPHRPGYDTWVLIFLSGCSLLYLGIGKETVFQAG